MSDFHGGEDVDVHQLGCIVVRNLQVVIKVSE